MCLPHAHTEMVPYITTTAKNEGKPRTQLSQTVVKLTIAWIPEPYLVWQAMLKTCNCDILQFLGANSF